MEPYARAYLQLLHSAVGGARAEAFVFATRLTRLTKVLHAGNPDHALHRAGQRGARLVGRHPDRPGAEGVQRPLRPARPGPRRGRGDRLRRLGERRPGAARREMERLSRLAHRIVWVNPRKAAAPGYQPLVGGMAAALPHVDPFVSGHSLAALDELLGRHRGLSAAPRRPGRVGIRKRHGPRSACLRLVDRAP